MPYNRLHRIRLLAGLLLVTSLLSACATSPTGRKQLMLVSEQSAINSSKTAYISTVGELDKQGKLEDDEAINRRVKDITGRLISQAITLYPRTKDWEWSVVVIDDPETVNAWCMAGGRMAIYTGLLQQIEPSDDELAQVMGHEIGHALANHTAEKMSVQMASSIGVAAIGIAADNHAAAMGGAALAAYYAVNMPNSRTAETEADEIGIKLAALAGYDPDSAASLWKKMGAQGKSPPQWMSTHPDPENRQKRLAELAPQMAQYYDPKAKHPVYKL